MLRRVIIFIYIVVACVACTKESSDDADAEVSQATLMYLMGMDLQSYYDDNLDAAMDAVAAGALGSHGALFCLYPESDDVSVLYQLKRSGDQCNKIEMCRYEDFSAYSVGSLSKVLDDVKSILDYTEDKRLNLVLSSHGYGWRLSSTATKSRSAEVSERVVDADGRPLTRFLGLYEEDGYLDIEDLCNEIDGTRFGFVLFDACLMSSVEVLYRMRDYCDYVVASPCEVLAAGFPYDTVVPEMFEEDGTSYDVGGMCQAYYDFYCSYRSPYCAVAVCVTSELEALAESVKALELKTLTATQLRSVQYYENLSTHLYYDLGGIVSAAYVSGNYDAFEAQMERAFPSQYRMHTAKFLSTLSGTSYISIDSDSYTGVSTSQMSYSSYATGWELEPWAIAIGADN